MNLNKFDNLTDLFFYQAERQDPKSVFLEWLNTTNRRKFTWSETTSHIYSIAKILKKNIKNGDRVLLVSENRPEWLISDLAIMLSNAISVPAYTTYTEEDYKYLIEDCKPSVVIVSNSKIHKKLENIIKNVDFIKKVITFDNIFGANYQNKYIEFNTIIKNKLLEEDKIKKTNLKRNSIACIIYTSGTGGNPKGVILSHGGILNNLEGAGEILKPLIKKNQFF